MELVDIAIDGRAEDVDLPAGACYRDLFSRVRERCGSRNRVLLSLRVNGQEIDAEGEGRLSGSVLPEGASVEGASAPVRDLSLQLLGDLRRHLQSLEGSHDEAARKVVSGDYPSAMKSFEAAFRGWSLFASGLRELSRVVRIDLDSVSSGDETGGALLQRMVEQLTRFKEAFWKKDVVLLGDLAQYELKPMLRGWIGMLASLQQRVESPG